MSRTVSAAPSGLRSQAATASPTAAAFVAVARPIPLPAPVTITTSPGVNPSQTWPPAIVFCLPSWVAPVRQRDGAPALGQQPGDGRSQPATASQDERRAPPAGGGRRRGD